MNGLRLLIIIMITTSLLPACDEVERGNNMGLTLIPFQEKAGGRWGFIDLKGNVAIEPDFKEKPSIFSEGFAIIKIIKSDEIYYDYINIEGKEMEQRFSYATRFNEGLALVIEENKAPFYIDKDMHTVFTLNDAEEAGVFSEGLAKFKDEEGEWGFVDKAGEVVIKPRYNYVSAYREGLALVTIESEDEDGGKIVEIGFINKNNKEVIKISDRYEELSSFSEGLAAFYDGHGWGFINKEGEKKIKAKDDRTRVTNFINGYASFQVDDGTWGLIDKNGEKILRAKYDRPVVFFNGLAAILQDGEYGFINQEGDKVIVPEFNDMGAPFVEGNAIVKDGKYFIFIDKKGLQINKNEVANVEATIADLYRYGFAFDFDETVESQFVNITQILGRVVQSLSAEEINGFNETTTLGDIIKKYNVIDEEVSDNTYNRTLELIEDSVVNSLCSFNLTVIFKQNLMIWDEYSYDDVVSSDAHVNIIVYTLNLKGRAVPRYMEIVEVLKNMLLDTGLNLLESDEEDTYYFGESIEEFAAAISFEEGEITFGYLFHTQDEEEDAYEEGAVEEYEYDL